MNCPGCGLINPGTAQRCDCGYDFINKSIQESYLTSTPNSAPAKIAIGAQVVALVLAGAAVIWGCCMVYVALYPGASGEFGGFSGLFAAMVDIPLGLVSLVVGLAVKKSPPVLRWTCIVLSVAALALPFLTKAAWQSHFRVK
ncbi:MAG TPA: hypothetical protein VHM93_04340 [Candidatus Acidoferrum sp.]|jgi:hypothetical protein|nr:hypothetical protein [Candidatus Acidoferrum sp.]